MARTDLPAPLLLLSPRQVAQALGLSTSGFYQLRASGRFGPRPLRLGRSVRYRRDELAAWVDAGCPSLERWQAMRKDGAA